MSLTIIFSNRKINNKIKFSNRNYINYKRVTRKVIKGELMYKEISNRLFFFLTGKLSTIKDILSTMPLSCRKVSNDDLS